RARARGSAGDAARHRRATVVDHLRRRASPAARRLRAVAERGRAGRPSRRGRGDLRHDARARPPAPGLRVLPLADGRSAGPRPLDMSRFGDAYFEHLDVNEPLIARLRAWHDDGLRMALCTNNVREWEPRWRAMIPVDELFETVVDSAFVGARKPDREIYEIVL